MKKRKIIVGIAIALVLCLGISVGLFICSLPNHRPRTWNDVEEFRSGEWTGYCNEKNTECFLTSWQWDGNMDHMQLTIPEEIDGLRVVGLGGFDYGYAMVFYIEMPEAYQIDNPDDLTWVTESDNIAADYPKDYPVFVFHVTRSDTLQGDGYCEDNLYCSTEDGQAIAYKVEMVFE